MEFSVVDIDSPLYRESLELRDKLLRIPLGLRLSKKEQEAEQREIHAVAIERNHVVAVALLRENGHGRMKMREVAVERAFQGKGLGKQLVGFAEKVAKFNGCAHLELISRKTTTDFYRKLGFDIIGDEVEEMGIPHVCMEKELYQME